MRSRTARGDQQGRRADRNALPEPGIDTSHIYRICVRACDDFSNDEIVSRLAWSSWSRDGTYSLYYGDAHTISS